MQGSYVGDDSSNNAVFAKAYAAGNYEDGEKTGIWISRHTWHGHQWHFKKCFEGYKTQYVNGKRHGESLNLDSWDCKCRSTVYDDGGKSLRARSKQEKVSERDF